MTPEFTYEMHPTMREDDGWVKCDESTADQWSVYKCPTTPNEQGLRLPVWVADFARKEVAQDFLELFHD